MNEKHDLTQGDVWGKLFGFFIPIAAGAIVQQLYVTVDALIVGRYCGTRAFAAISGSVNHIIMMMVGTFIALTGGASVYISQLYGIKDREKISKAVTTAMMICFGLGVVLAVVGIIFSNELLVLLKTPEDTLVEANVYLRYCFAMCWAVMLYNMGAGILRASGDSTRPFIYLCACCLTNIVLDYVMVAIFGMGVAGAALATQLSQVISFGLVLQRMLRAKDEHYKLELSFKNFSMTAVKATLKYGLPSAAQQIVYGLSNIAVQVGINTLGTAVVAAWALTGKVDGIYWAIVNAGGIAVMNFVGQNYGAGKLDRVKEVSRKGLRNFMLFTVVICTLLVIFGRHLFPLFLKDPEVCDLAYRLMLFFVIPYPLWTVIEIMSGVLKGCGDVVVSAVISLIGIAGVRLVWIYTVFVEYHNAYTLALCYGVSWVITAAALYIRYRTGGWKKRREL